MDDNGKRWHEENQAAIDAEMRRLEAAGMPKREAAVEAVRRVMVAALTME